jgi:glycosyltransferase involved in cell wall biosynthesis
MKESCIFAADPFWDAATSLSLLDEIAPALRWPVLVAGSLAAREPRHVWYLGPLDHADVRQRLARAAIYVHPAHREPIDPRVLEAARAGCALVLSDLPSLRRIWGSAALYVNPDDRVGLRDTLAQLIADQPLRARLAAAARARTLKEAMACGS